MQERARKLCSQFDRAKDRRRNWENMWQEIADHMLGRRDFTVKRDEGRQRNVKIYDTTASDANVMLSTALHALLTNPATKWFDLRYEDAELNDVDDAVLYLEQVRDMTLAAFARPESGFTTNIAEVYSDLTGFNTAVMFVADDPAFGPKFMSRPLSETFIDVDQAGRLAIVYRCFHLRGWQAIDFFGDDLTPTMRAKAENDSDCELEFLHVVQRRALPKPGMLDASGMPWESVYVAVDEKVVIRDGGFREMPYMVPRWSVDPGELYGRGPGTKSLPDAKMLNALWFTYIRNAEKAVDPPLLVNDDSVLPGSQLRVTPSAMNTVRNDGISGDPIRYLESRSQFQWARDIMELKSARVEKAFHSEVIQVFQKPNMTATEVIELSKLSQRILSPVLGRMQVELLEPMIERVVGILSRRSDFPAPPPELEGAALKIEYVSPVARVQKASESQAILDSFAATVAFAEADPSVIDNVDLDEATRKVFDGNGVPVSLMRSREEVAQRRALQAQALAEERAKQEQLELAKGVGDVLPGIAALNKSTQ